MRKKMSPTRNAQWDRLQARLSTSDLTRSRILIALDFDGTLSEIADTPDQAALAEETRRLLALLVQRPDTKVAVISGRRLDDVKSRVGLPGIYYAGNHGLEIEGPGIRWTHPQARGVDASVYVKLQEDLRAFPGHLLEHKSPGFAVHYRGVATRLHARLRKMVRARLRGLRPRFRVLRGKMTLDSRPDIPWNKGHALRMIRRTLAGSWTCVFIGDDVTDEEAFASLGRQALTLRIGRVKISSAQHILRSRRLVDLLLESLSRRSGGGPPPQARSRR